MDHLNYCERFLEMLIDLETSLPTRRFFHVVLDDVHLINRCYLSLLSKRDEGHLFKQVCLSKFYCAKKSINEHYFLTAFRYIKILFSF